MLPLWDIGVEDVETAELVSGEIDCCCFLTVDFVATMIVVSSLVVFDSVVAFRPLSSVAATVVVGSFLLDYHIVHSI